MAVLCLDFEIAWLLYSASPSWPNRLYPSASGTSLVFAFVPLGETVWWLVLRGAENLACSLTLGFWFICCRSSTFCPRLSLVAMFVYLLWESINLPYWKITALCLSSWNWLSLLTSCPELGCLSRAAQMQGPVLRLLTLLARGQCGDCWRVTRDLEKQSQPLFVIVLVGLGVLC